MIITPINDIYVISRFTGLVYHVKGIEIKSGKIKRYFIKNQGRLEWWDKSRFYEPANTYKCCEYCQCKCRCCK